MKNPNENMLFRSGDPNFMTSLVRGLEVLKSFSASEGELTAAEISKMTGLSRAVVRRCLYTLSEAGYVHPIQDRYRLEPKVLSLAQPYYNSARSFPATAQPFLEMVSEATNESCSLAVMDGDEVVYVARAATRRIMTVSLNIGSRLPADCTSLGRVLLASLNATDLTEYLKRNPLASHTAKSITSKKDFRQAIAKARELGYALVDEELEVGLRSIAVPVADRNGTLIAAMNVGVQATRVSSAELRRRILPTLQDAASNLGCRLEELGSFALHQRGGAS